MSLRKNPLGLYVDAIDWSQELDTAAAGAGAASPSAVASGSLRAICRLARRSIWPRGAAFPVPRNKEQPMTFPSILALAAAGALIARPLLPPAAGRAGRQAI